MITVIAGEQNANDSEVDEIISRCLDLDSPKSFFLYAGAGSGKTRSLVSAIDRIRLESKRKLFLTGKRIAVITYTNAACDEIKRRLEFDSLVEVSTIHSFAWSLIGGFNSDIRTWLQKNLIKEIAEIEVALAKGRSGTKAERDRGASIVSKGRRLENIGTVRQFIYSPTGNNSSRDSLNHTEVIGITSDFLKEKATLRDVLVSQYPILLVDESQDTNRHLMDAFLAVQETHKKRFCLGLFGDTMQRIYSDGKINFDKAIPEDWVRPAKLMNHRCPQRIIRLINRIRSGVDDQEQIGRSDKPEGVVRLFLRPASAIDKLQVESSIAERMAEVTNDNGWSYGTHGYKTLILEHHMAAKRMGFDAMFEPLYKVGRFGTGLLDGSLPGIRLFSNDVLPVIEAMRRNDSFAVAGAVKRSSPLLDREFLRVSGAGQLEQLAKAKLAVDELWSVCKGDLSPTFLDVLHCVSSTGLFQIPDVFRVIVQSTASDNLPTESNDEEDEELVAWRQFLATPFNQIEAYAQYIYGKSPFATHQGVKGLEFARVMVVISDEEARGFMFSYEKLFGAKGKSAADLRNESDGNETTIDRTRRLLYVTCSRAESSLAIVAYSEDPESVRRQVVNEGWFGEDEIDFLV